MRYKKSKKYLDQNEVFTWFERFVRDSGRGRRTRKDGERLGSESVNNYTFCLMLLKEFTESQTFDLKLYLVDHHRASDYNRIRMYYQQFYQSFTQFLYEDKGYYDNYVGQTIKILKSFMAYLIVDQQINLGTYHKSFRVPRENIPIVVLNPDQLAVLIRDGEEQSILPEHLHEVRDIFVLGCTVALRFSDLMALRSHNLVKQGDDYYLQVRSQKTQVDTRIKLPDYAIRILRNRKGKYGRLLPQYHLAVFNKLLKEMAVHILPDEISVKQRSRRGRLQVVYKNPETRSHYRLSDHFSSHTMRRTAITTMLRLGIHEQIVRKISGHAPHSKEFYRYIEWVQSHIDHETDRAFQVLSPHSTPPPKKAVLN